MKQIVILTDYKGYFGSKQKSKFYNSGFNLEMLSILLQEKGYFISIRRLTDINFRTDTFKESYVLYTSSEDRGQVYKQFIEDILLGIKLLGGILIPDFLFFRAHDNKVFMEILRDVSSNQEIKNIFSSYYGTFEDLNSKKKEFKFPLIIKSAAGSKSRGVELASDFNILCKKARKLSRSFNYWDIFKEFVRKHKYTGYIPNSSHRNKFLVQNFIASLDHDYKVLIFNTKYYILKRKVKPNDFRASGQGLLEYTDNIPEGLFDFAERTFKSFDVPFISLDIAFDGKEYFLLEFQILYFGTYTLEHSEFYYMKIEGSWVKKNEKSELEVVFADAIDAYINRQKMVFKL